MLFDLGRIDRQPAATLLKVTHVFVSHTHMDHFIGFDHLLRIFLARDREIELFGPPGIIDNVRGKLAGYTWNLIDCYPFVLTVHEVGRETHRRACACRRAPRLRPSRRRAAAVRRRRAVRRPRVHGHRRASRPPHPVSGLRAGGEDAPERAPRAARSARRAGRPLAERAQGRACATGAAGRHADSRRMARRRGDARRDASRSASCAIALLVETRGQKIAYVVDTLFSRANLERISELVARRRRLLLRIAVPRRRPRPGVASAIT